jgi:hypothetical protein
MRRPRPTDVGGLYTWSTRSVPNAHATNAPIPASARASAANLADHLRDSLEAERDRLGRTSLGSTTGRSEGGHVHRCDRVATLPRGTASRYAERALYFGVIAASGRTYRLWARGVSSIQQGRSPTQLGQRPLTQLSPASASSLPTCSTTRTACARKGRPDERDAAAPTPSARTSPGFRPRSRRVWSLTPSRNDFRRAADTALDRATGLRSRGRLFTRPTAAWHSLAPHRHERSQGLAHE